MPKFTLAQGSLIFAGTTYRCLTTYTMSQSVEEAMAACSGETEAVVHRSAGAKSATLSITVLLENGVAGVNTINELMPKMKDTMVFRPESDTPGAIEVVAGSALITQADLGASTGALTTLAVTLGIDGPYIVQVVP